MNYSFLFLTFLIATLGSNEVVSVSNKEMMTNGFANFAVEMYQEVAKENDDNIIYSPFSIETALLLLFMGASGETANEISEAFELYPLSRTAIAKAYSGLYNSNEDPNYTIANKIYIANEYTINAEFNEIAEDTFGSETESIDFGEASEAAAEINDWVECQTNDKIKELFLPSDFSANTVMVIVNAIYFKGEWLHQFPKSDTQDLPFWTSETESVEVETMTVKNNFKVGSFPSLGLETIELAYKNSDVTMMILLPLSRNGLADLEDELNNIDFFELSNEMTISSIKLWMPKFVVNTKLDLEDLLKALGMPTMFSGSANFNNLLETPESLSVTKAVHKAFIAVDENGTEAAAATGIVITKSAGSKNPKEVRVDHPFLYVLKNKNTILFMGSVKSF